LSTLNLEKFSEYLSKIHKAPIKLYYVGELGKKKKKYKPKKELKGFGYGNPYLIEYKIKGKLNRVILETIRGGSFGHNYQADRAQNLILAHSTFNKLSKHVKSIDVGAFCRDGSIISLGDSVEFFILVEKVDGEEYYKDLERIREKKKVTKTDLDRCKVLSDYLKNIHSTKKSEPDLYIRRVRDLIGHGECIFGLIDSYPSKLDFTDEKELAQIEKKCIEWRWRIKNKTHRLCQVHGDFHPWNVMFRKNVDFTVLDRSRGEWGEAADDVAAMSVNYLFFSLQAYGKLAEPFTRLFNIFLGNYLEKTGDEEILEVIQPFYAWRSLVVASPIWYPHLSYDVRRKLFNFIQNVLSTEKLEVKDINSYLKGS
jgi:hypothetical protein